MQNPERLQEIQELVKNTPTKDKTRGKRPTLVKNGTPSKKHRANLSPTTRARLTGADDILAQAQALHAEHASSILGEAVSNSYR